MSKRIVEVPGGGFAVTNGAGIEYCFKKLTIKIARDVCASWGLTLTKDDADEFRVNKRGGREATTAYTNDLLDAVNTGIAMAEKGAW
jgi:hypothetical protein